MRCFVRSSLLMVTLAGTFRLMGQVSPLGGEFRVNGTTTLNQQYPAVAALSAGGFVVVWSSNVGSGTGYEINLQRYSSAGGPVGVEFQVNTYTTGSQRIPAVAATAEGFVVVWQTSNPLDGSAEGILGQRFDASGGTLGSEFAVNSYTSLTQRTASVAATGSGGFVVVWASNGEDGNSYGIFGQRYTSAGSPSGGEFRVNTYTTLGQNEPGVANLPSGGFVVVWTGSSVLDGSGVMGQRYDATGAPAGGEFLVNTYTTNSQFRASVSSAPNGDFVVEWTSFLEDGNSFGVFGQRFGSSGAAAGDEFRVSTYTTNSQDYGSVAADAAGNFVVVWHSVYQFAGVPFEEPSGERHSRGPGPLGGVPPGAGIFSQAFSSSGSQAGAEFRVNTYTTSGQGYPQVAADSSGTFLVVWVSTNQEASRGVFAQRYCSTLTSVTISLMGSAALCPGGAGGTATVADAGGGPSSHQWGYRTMTGGGVTGIAMQTGTSYMLNATDFPGAGSYFLVETTTPPVPCGLPIVSNEIAVTVGDSTVPSVMPPPAATTPQTLCQ